EINARLQGHVSPVILVQDNVLQDDALHYYPDTLLTTIYLQFAYDLVGGTPRQIICEGCHRGFPQRRRDQRHCSKRCRERARHHRKAGTLKQEPDTHADSYLSG